MSTFRFTVMLFGVCLLAQVAFPQCASLPDLVVIEVDDSGVVTDCATNRVSGTVTVLVSNRGSLAAGPFGVAVFEDVDRDGMLSAGDNVLGSSTHGGLNPKQDGTVNTTVAGVTLFRDNLLHAAVDPAAAVSEALENNNTRSSGDECAVPILGAYNGVTRKWVVPSFLGWLTLPLVVNLTDDNTDGAIDENDVPDVLVSMCAYSGDTGALHFCAPVAAIEPASHAAVGDINGDGRPEIIHVTDGVYDPVPNLMAFSDDGTLLWESDPVAVAPGFRGGGSAIADLDGDGTPEIVFGSDVFRADGRLWWSGTAGHGKLQGWGPLAVVADLDLDGNPEVVTGNSAYRCDGSVYWHRRDLGDGWTAIGNFDADPNPEVVLATTGDMFMIPTIHLLDHDGSSRWQTALASTGVVGPPAVDDYDGDGAPEIVVNGAGLTNALDTDGSFLWRLPCDMFDFPLGVSGYDFEGDGTTEVLLADC